MTDPLEVELYADGPLMRCFASPPVQWQEERAGNGYWAVTGYNEVVAVSRDHAIRGATLPARCSPPRSMARASPTKSMPVAF